MKVVRSWDRSHGCLVGIAIVASIGCGSIGDSTRPSVPADCTGRQVGLPTLAAADGAVCSIRPDGSVWCWGSLVHEWRGASARSAGPVRIPLPAPATSVAVRSTAGCAVLLDGHVACWGYLPIALVESIQDSQDFRHGTEERCDLDRVLLPTDTVLPSSTSVILTRDLVCVSTRSGSVECLGANEYGSVGAETRDGPHSDWYCHPTPVLDSDGRRLTDIVSISAFEATVCATKENGIVSCWGVDEYGQASRVLGNRGLRFATEVPGVRGWQMATSGSSTCVLGRNGRLECWGKTGINPYDGSLQPGDSIPLEVPLRGHEVEAVYCGRGECCGSAVEGDVHCWGGFDEEGVLRTGIRRAPVDHVRNIVFASEAYCAEKRDVTRSVVCWGSNASLELGVADLEEGHFAENPVSVVFRSNRR